MADRFFNRDRTGSITKGRRRISNRGRGYDRDFEEDFDL